MSNYIVKEGQSILDVSLNSTGTSINVDAILQANNIETWSPDLKPGAELIVPEGLPQDLNSKRQLAEYPAFSNYSSSIASKLEGVFEQILGNWILRNGIWNDQGIWLDSFLWID